MTDHLVANLGLEPMGVDWRAPLLNYSGYASEARAFVVGLRGEGWTVSAQALEPVDASLLGGLPSSERAELESAMSEPPYRYGTAVHHMPAHCIDPAVSFRNVARTMFETDRIPGSWVERLNAVDEVWVPSAFNVETFRRAGVRSPLHVVPGGVDAAVYRPGLDPLRLEETRGTVFLSVFEWSYRKAWDVLLRAWSIAFKPGDDVTLVIRSHTLDPSGRHAPDEISRRIDAFLHRIGRSRSSVAPIVVLDRAVPVDDMPRLYAAADVYVGVSRGEGWGRPLLEAMSTGLPTIGTRWSGNLEFMNDGNSLLVDVKGLVAVDRREELDFYSGHRWAEPSARHFAKLMVRSAEDRAMRLDLGQRARADVEQYWTWGHAVEIASERLQDIETRSRRSHAGHRPDAPRVRWVGDVFARHSLAMVNQEVCRRLVDGGDVNLEVVTPKQPIPDIAANAALAGLVASAGPVLDDRAQVEVRHQWPPDWSVPGSGAWVVVQPWEFGALPQAWLPALVDQVDEVWCYTEYVRDVYLASGLPAERLRVIPLGVDADRFRPDGDRFPLKTRRTHKLLFVGGTIARKGIDLLLRAYRETFTADDDVCLVIKSFGSESFYRDTAVDAEIRDLQDDPSGPDVELVTDDLEPDEIAALYRSCDALVHPYRGEGFGLPIIEAMASGVPVVVTGMGACLDFCDDDTAFLVPAERRRISDDSFGPAAGDYWVAEPDLAELARLMRLVIEDRPLAEAKAARARARVVEEFPWERTTAAVQERLAALAGIEPRRNWALLRARAASPFPLDTEDRVTFVAVTDWSPDSLRDTVVAYARAFRAADPTTLVLYLDADAVESSEDAVRRVAEALGMAGIDPDRTPDILLVPETLHPGDVDRLHAAADAVVNPEGGGSAGWWHDEVTRVLSERAPQAHTRPSRHRNFADTPTSPAEEFATS